MSSELRTKIIHAIQAPGSFSDWAERAADRIIAEIASLNPPATAKLPEGMEIVKCVDGRYDVWTKDHSHALSADGKEWLCYNFFSDASGVLPTESEALTAALSAPPVPGKSKAATIDHANSNWIDTMSARIAELEAALQTISNLARHSHMNSGARLTRIELAVLKAMRSTPTEKPHYVATELNDINSDAILATEDFSSKDVTAYARTLAEKPDPRKIAPNGRAMVRYTRPINGAHYGLDDNGKWWVWCDWLDKPRKWREPEMKDEFAASGKPCTFDGTPITETKPDPLARAVTVGEMLRLAERMYNVAEPFNVAIRAIFAPPQGAEHV